MTHLPITETVPGDQRPEANRGEHVTGEEYHQRSRYLAPHPGFAVNAAPQHDGVRTHADPPDLRPLGSMPSRQIGNAERRLGGASSA